MRTTAPGPDWSSALRVAHGATLLAVLAAAPLALGTVPVPARVVVFLACAALFAIAMVRRTLAGRRMFVGPPLYMLGAATCFTALQLLPLPASVLRLLAPQADAIFQTSLGNYGHHALSLDPPGTLRELAKLAAYCAFYIGAVSYATRHQRRLWFLLGVVGVGTTVAVLALLQLMVGTSGVLFFYEPAQQFSVEVARGSFVNPNHFGALMTMSAPCALVLALQQPAFRRPALAALALQNLACLLSNGRSSILTILVAQVAVGILLLVTRTRPRPGQWRALLAFTVLILVAATSRLIWVWDQSSLAELRDPASKYVAWAQALRLIGDYPLTGVGRGAFEQAFATVAANSGRIRYPWVENAYLQPFADWGIPAGLLLLGLGAWAIVSGAKRIRHDALLIAPVAALIGLALHDLVDFSSELPGVGLPALALLAMLHGRRDSSAERGPVWMWMRPRLATLAAPVTVAALAVGQALPRARDADSDGAALVRAVRDPAVSTAKLLELGRLSWARHPADYFIPLATAERLVTERHPQAIRWLNAAMSLAPGHPLPHQLAAELLAALGRKGQAIGEYRSALERLPGGWELYPLLARWYPSVEDLLAAAPARLRLELSQWLHVVQRPLDGDLVLERALQQSPRDTKILAALIPRQLARGQHQSALHHARRMNQIEGSQAARLLEAKASVAAGDLPNATRILVAPGEDVDGQAAGLQISLAEAHLKLGNVRAARDWAERLSALAHLNQTTRNRLHELRAAIELQTGNPHKARWELEQRVPSP